MYGVEILEQATKPVTLELVRGVDARFRFLGDSDEAKWWNEHLLFVLEKSQLGSVTGPYPSQGGPSNHRINGINVWIESGALIHQLVQPADGGLASLKGLPSGRYSVTAIPDDFVFEPASFDVGEETNLPIEIHWRCR